jgi:hypothetical protein
LRRKNEAQLIEASVKVGNRVVDNAIPPARVTAPSIKRDLGAGLGLGFVLGLVLAFLIQVLDPRIRDSGEAQKLVGEAPLAEVRSGAPEETAAASSVLALAVMRNRQPSLALVKPGHDDPDARDLLEKVIGQLSASLRPLLLVDGSGETYETSFFGVPSAPGLSEISSGKDSRPTAAKDFPVLVFAPGHSPSSVNAASRKVLDAIGSLQGGFGATMFHAPNVTKEPAIRGWGVHAGGAVLILMRNRELKSEISAAVKMLEADNVPVLAALLLG